MMRPQQFHIDIEVKLRSEVCQAWTPTVLETTYLSEELIATTAQKISLPFQFSSGSCVYRALKCRPLPKLPVPTSGAPITIHTVFCQATVAVIYFTDTE